jgi:hypothetical protein
MKRYVLMMWNGTTIATDNVIGHITRCDSRYLSGIRKKGAY